MISGNIYIVDTSTNPRSPLLHKYIDNKVIKMKKGITYPHTTHCLANGTIAISYMGNKKFI